MKRFVISSILVVFICFAMVCQRSFSPAAYFPLKVGYCWNYSGLLHTVTVSEMTKLQDEERYTITMYDSLGHILGKELYIKRGGIVYWAAFMPNVATIPTIYFEPPIPISPISNKIGEILRLQVVEKREDGETLRVRVTCKIEEIGRLKIGIGLFPDCIKMNVLYESLESEKSSVLVGTSFYWYAKNVGMVRYSMPSGEGELLRAKLNEDKSSQ